MTLIFLVLFAAPFLGASRLEGDAFDLRPARVIIEEARASAIKDKKRLLIVFGASWCEPCELFQKGLQAEPWGGIIAKNYVVVNLRAHEKSEGSNNGGALELYNEWNPTNLGIPFYAVLSDEGKKLDCSVVATNKRAHNLVGFRGMQGERLLDVLRNTGLHVSEEDIKIIEDWMYSNDSEYQISEGCGSILGC